MQEKEKEYSTGRRGSGEVSGLGPDDPIAAKKGTPDAACNLPLLLLRVVWGQQNIPFTDSIALSYEAMYFVHTRAIRYTTLGS